MSESAAEHTRPPQYLQEVETIIDLPFFPDTAREESARTDPSQLTPEELSTRIPLYVAGLRIVAAARKEHGWPLTGGSVEAVRQERYGMVGELRGELMTLEPDLESAAVKAIRSALDTMAAQPGQPSLTGRKKVSGRPPEALPPTHLPAAAIERLINLGQGSALNAAKQEHIEAALLRLPGPGTKVACFDWSFVRQLAEQRGLRTGMSIDWTRLPRGAQDQEPGWQERVAYAREIQAKVVERHRLRNIPELAGIVAPSEPVPIARPYHVSRSQLKRLLRGDYRIIERYMEERQIDYEYRQRTDRAGYSQYLRIEDVGKALEDGERVPWATGDDMRLNTILREAGYADATNRSEQIVRRVMTPDEIALLSKRRTAYPPGRIAAHVPRELGKTLVDRLSYTILPLHLAPIRLVAPLVDADPRDLTRKARRRHLDTTTLRIHGNSFPLVCADWQTLEQLCPTLPLDFDLLPRNAEETDARRITYGRKIHAMLMAIESKDKAIPREGPPVHAVTMADLYGSVPKEKHISEEALTDFIKLHGGMIELAPDGTRYVFGIGVGLVNYNFKPDQHRPQAPARDWLDRNELAKLTGQDLEQIDADLEAMDWNALRPSLVPRIVQIGTDSQQAANVHLLWFRRGKDPDELVLPHYNPAIVEHLESLSFLRQTSDQPSHETQDEAPTIHKEEADLASAPPIPRTREQPQDEIVAEWRTLAYVVKALGVSVPTLLYALDKTDQDWKIQSIGTPAHARSLTPRTAATATRYLLAERQRMTGRLSVSLEQLALAAALTPAATKDVLRAADIKGTYDFRTLYYDYRLKQAFHALGIQLPEMKY